MQTQRKQYAKALDNVQKALVIHEKLGRLNFQTVVPRKWLALIHWCQGNAPDATDARHLERQATFQHLVQALPYQSAAEQRKFLIEQRISSDWAFSQALGLRDHAIAREKAAEWLLNFQGTAERLFAQRELEAQQATDPTARHLLAERQKLRDQIAALAGKKVPLAQSASLGQEIEVLEQNAKNLQKQLQQQLGTRTELEWITLQQVQDQLKAKQALVLFTRMKRLAPEMYGQSAT
ncbi:MAG: hypothetical protein ACRCZF_17990, partial [Gemmataceae bacterium]